jgi:hypothetical protein
MDAELVHQIQRIRTAAEKAHPGPWFAGKPEEGEWELEYITIGPFEADNHYESTLISLDSNNHPQFEDTAKFIALCDPQTVLSLLSVITGLQRKVSVLEAEVEAA